MARDGATIGFVPEVLVSDGGSFVIDSTGLSLGSGELEECTVMNGESSGFAGDVMWLDLSGIENAEYIGFSQKIYRSLHVA
jgi:hypothetical protein